MSPTEKIATGALAELQTRIGALESALQKLRRQLMIEGIECFRFDLPAIAKAASHAEKAFTSEKPPTPWQRLRTDVRMLRDGLILAQETLGLCKGDGGLLGRVEAIERRVAALEQSPSPFPEELPELPPELIACWLKLTTRQQNNLLSLIKPLTAGED